MKYFIPCLLISASMMFGMDPQQAKDFYQRKLLAKERRDLFARRRQVGIRFIRSQDDLNYLDSNRSPMKAQEQVSVQNDLNDKK